jgi:hypothetical protein
MKLAQGNTTLGTKPVVCRLFGCQDIVTASVKHLAGIVDIQDGCADAVYKAVAGS